MRFQQFMEQIVNPVVEHKFGNTQELASNVRGGWEVWMQIEIYFQLNNSSVGVESFDREANYPNSSKKADFKFSPRNASDTTTWVELKVQNQDDVQDALNRFAQDIDKVSSVTVPSNDSVGAMVIIPCGDYRTTLDTAKDYFSRIKTKIACYLVNDSSVSKVFKLSDSPPTVRGNAPAVIMCYSK